MCGRSQRYGRGCIVIVTRPETLDPLWVLIPESRKVQHKGERGAKGCLSLGIDPYEFLWEPCHA